LILVDSPVWVDFFSRRPGPAGHSLKRMIERASPVVLTGVVITVVLQGLTRDAALIKGYLRKWDQLEPRGFSTYREAAAIFRLARSKGFSLTTIDVLIATIALENRAAVFTLDKDFSRIASITNLRLHSP
jgi:predicted nucleic acid-binding protein